MASARNSGDERDELAQGLPAAGAAPFGGDQPDLPRPLGDRATEAMTGSPATNEPIGDAAREARMHRAGSRLLLVGGVLFVIGLIISLIADGGLSDGIGVAFMFLALVPTLAGVAMELAAMVNRRGRRGGSFA